MLEQVLVFCHVSSYTSFHYMMLYYKVGYMIIV